MKDPIRILIVEDNPNDFDLAQREIRKSLDNCEIKRVETEEEYLTALESLQPDIILSDYGLPGFNGMKALKLAREHAVLTPFIMWTGSISEEAAAECMKAGANNYILKENITRLGPAILHALEERQLLLERKEAEDKLRRSESNYRALAEHSLQGIAIFQKQRIIYANPALCMIMGYTADELLALSEDQILAQTHPDDRAVAWDRAMRRQSGENISPFNDLRIVRKNGDIRWIQTCSNSIEYDGQPAILSTSIDITERKQAEGKFQTIYENSPVGIFQSTPQGQFINVNPAMAHIYGYDSPEEMINSVNDIAGQVYLKPEERGTFTHSLETQGTVENFEFENVRKDGSIFWSSTSAWVVRGQDGTVLYYEGFLQDITARKEADERLIESEKRFRALIENGMDNISILAEDGSLLWENPAVHRTLGYRPGEFIGRNIFELVHPDDLPWTSDLFARVIREPRHQEHGTFRLKYYDGTWRWIEATATNMLDESSLQAIVVNYRDVTERRTAEEELKESQAKYRNLVETSHDLIWSVDADGRFTYVNRAARHIYGYEPEELIGQSYFDIMDPEHHHLTPETFREAIAATNEYHMSETYVRHRDGRQFVLSANSIVLRDENGNVTGVTGTSRDITEQKRAEEALREERNLLRTLIDHLPDRIYAMDKQGRKTLSNIADWRASGRKTMEDVIGKTDFDVYPAELAEPFWQLDRAVLDSGQTVINFEEPGLDFEGRPVSILTSKIPLRDEAGNIIGLVGIGRDITERRRAEEALRENEQRYRTLFEDMPIAIWEEDFSEVKKQLDALKAQGVTDFRAYFTSHPEELSRCTDPIRILNVNNKAVKMYHANDKQELIDSTLQEDSTGEKANNIEDLIAIAEGRTSHSWEGGDETSDGIPLEIRLSWSVVPGHEEDYSKVIVTTIDITEPKRVEKAEREQRALAEALRDTAQQLSSTLDYGEVLDHILAAVERVVPHNAATIMLIEGDFAHVVRSHGHAKMGVKDDVLGIQLPLATTDNLKQMLGNRQPVIIYDTSTYKGWKRMGITDWVRSNVGAPISIQGEVIGFILLDSETPKFFTPLHAERLEAFANQAALAIHNARLLHQVKDELAERKRTEIELQQKNDDLRLLNTVNNAIVRGQNLDSIIDLLTAELKRIFSAVGSTIYMLSADKRSLTMQQYSFSPEIEHRIEKLIGFKIPKIEIPVKEGGHFHNALITKQSTITSDPQKIQEWIGEFAATRVLPSIARTAARKLIPNIYKLLNIKSTILVPLISHEEVIGFLDVSGPSVFARNDLKRIENIGEQLTSLIQRQQANEQLRKSEEFLQGVQNSLSAHMAILDESGTIVQVNEAWRRFGEQNGLLSADYCVGMNYIATCETATGPDADVAKEMAVAIRQILAGKRADASFEYACHGPTEKRWFTVQITCFDDGKQKWSILAHENITTRKVAEIALGERTAQFRTLFEASPDAIVLIDPIGQWPIVDCNSAAASMNGYTREELIGKSIDILNPRAEQGTPESRSAYLESIKNTEVLRYEAIHMHKNGTPIVVEVSTTLIRLGGRDMVLGIDRDITARKLIEEKLQQSETRYRTVVENQTEFIVRWKPDGTRTFANDAYCRYFGITQEEALNTAFMPFIHDDDRQLVDEKISRLLSGASSVETDSHRVLRPGGSICWNEWTDQAIYDEAGQLIEFQAVGRDITERRRAENELRDSEERFRQLASNIQEVFWITDAISGEEIYISPASEKIWGRQIESLMENPNIFLNSILPEDHDHVARIIEEQRNGKNTDMEYRIVWPDGSVHWIWDRAFPIFDETGKVIRLTGIAADITPRKQSELESQRHLTELEALYENGLTIGQLLEPREIGNHIIQTFAKHLSWHHVAIRLLNPETDKLDLIAFNQPDLSDEDRAEIESRFNRMVSTVGQGLSGLAMQTGTSIRTGNVHTHPQYVDTHQGIMSGLYMPLKVADRIIGCISVESDLPDAFTQQDERLLATLANQASIAFENARLYQAAQLEISQRRRAQEALWVSETHYRQLADSITDILFELDQDLRYTHWNKASEMFSGIPAEDAIGRPMQDVFGSSESQLERESVYRGVLRDRQARTFETQVTAKGQKRYLEINAYPSAHGVSVVAKDITERRLAETLMRKRFELMEYAANHTLDEVMLRTIDEICELTGSPIGFFNFMEEDQETVHLSAWSSEALKLAGNGIPMGAHFPLDKAGPWTDAIRQRRSLIHNDPASIQETGAIPQDHPQLIRDMMIPIIRNERLIGIVGNANKTQNYTQHDLESAERLADYSWDIIERKEMETEIADERNQLARRVEERTADLSRANSNLARALRVKDEFLANMSHELRTPLNAILGLSESLGEQVAGPLNEKQQKYLATINESGHHLLSLINDILDLAKIEAGQISLDINKVEVNGVCQASLRMIKQLAQRKHQEISFEIDQGMGWMWADERRLKQMIVNLLSNAVKFTPDSGVLGLEVRGDREANRISISVWDRGIGINNNDVQRIFQPFVQLDSGLAREAAGTGLGLALVSQMAKLHGGSVTVASQPGQGSRFTIMLPWEPALAGESNSRLRTSGKFRAIKPNEMRPTILLIEDTQEVVMMLVDYLEMAGFNMVTAQDGIDGLTQAKIAHPDLILMDIQMPRMDGFETTKKLRSDPEFKETPIIALTALAMPDDRQRCLDVGMNEYLSKPVNLKALAKTIKAFLYEAETKES